MIVRQSAKQAAAETQANPPLSHPQPVSHSIRAVPRARSRRRNVLALELGRRGQGERMYELLSYTHERDAAVKDTRRAATGTYTARTGTNAYAPQGERRGEGGGEAWRERDAR